MTVEEEYKQSYAQPSQRYLSALREQEGEIGKVQQAAKNTEGGFYR